MNREQMLAPFAEEELQTFAGRGGKTMTYVEDETVMDRLDIGYGPGNWQLGVEAIPYVEGVVKVRLGIRPGGIEWIWYEDFGYANREGGEALKEAVTDGIRRCGRFVGIARDLYRKDSPPPVNRPAPRGIVQTAAAPYVPAESSDPDVNDAKEFEEMLGRVSRRGIIRKGSAEGYKLTVRQHPEGLAFGFRLEIAEEKAIPQCVLTGAIAASVLTPYPDPSKLVGTVVTVAGLLYNVKRSDKPGSWYRLHVDRFQNDDYIFPADAEPALPAPGDDVPLVGEAESEPLGLVG